MSYGSLQSISSLTRSKYEEIPGSREEFVEINGKNFGRGRSKNFSWRYGVVLMLCAVAFVSVISSRHDLRASAPQRSQMDDRSISGIALFERVENEKKIISEAHGGDVMQLFHSFKEVHGRKYESDSEEQIRFEAFKKNLALIDKMNAANKYALFGINNFADILDSERKAMRMSKKFSAYENLLASLPQRIIDTAPYGVADKFVGKKSQSKLGDVDMFTDMVGWITEDDCAACSMYPELAEYNTANMPLTFDWRTEYETPVGNQGGCGSCWTFSTVGDVEGKWFLATGEVYELSKQQLVACDQNPGLAEGCNGGLPLEAYQYIANAGGLVLEENYPYKAICAGCDGYYNDAPICDTDQITESLQDNSVAHVGAWQVVALGAQYEQLLATTLVKNGPISISLNADGMEYYKYGIADDIDGCNPEMLDHAVLLVGYGVEDNIPYFIIKNSWGTEWGESGYFRGIRGFNYCGLSNYATTSVVKMP